MVNLDLQVQRNLKGIELEKAGEVEKAIELYEANIADNFDGNHPYDRLAVIYRRLGKTDDEIRVLRKGIWVFENIVGSQRADGMPKLDRFKKRLEKTLAIKGEVGDLKPTLKPATQGPMDDNEQVNLDDLDGFEFERVCHRILERIGYGEVEDIVDVGDEGKDLVAQGPQGRMIVECKHSPDSSVGRPIIQKLHSATVSSGCRIGMIITTGSFSKTALQYAERLSSTGVQIKLVDRSLLADMAARAGIEFTTLKKPMSVWTYDVSEQENLDRAFARFLDSSFESHPAKPSQMLEILARELELIPAFEIRYDVDAIFKTSIGLVHHEARKGGRFMLEAETGKPLKDEFPRFFEGLPLKRFSSDSFKGWHPKEMQFQIDMTRMRELAKNEIIRRHTKSVSYVGGNNRMYEKTCVPNEKQITLCDLRQLYIPISTSNMKILKTQYKVRYLDHPSGKVDILGNTLLQCVICNEPVNETKPYLCNVCGRPCHPRKTFSSHGFKCRICGKTMCKDCTAFKRNFILKSPRCPSCMDLKKPDVEKAKSPSSAVTSGLLEETRKRV
jgi:tetratricopeptide (TPR) repeat protein